MLRVAMLFQMGNYQAYCQTKNWGKLPLVVML